MEWGGGGSTVKTQSSQESDKKVTDNYVEPGGLCKQRSLVTL